MSSSERERLAKENGMTVEFVDWFFDTKKEGCGNVWFMMMAAMWEGWKEQESRCAALAAENAGLKAALRPSDIPSEWTDAFGDTAVIEHDSTGDNQGHSVSWSWVGNQEEVIKSVLLAVDNGIETPATDAFLAEVRAQGVERLANAWYAIANETDQGISISDSSRLKYRQRADDAADFANEIRQEVAQ